MGQSRTKRPVMPQLTADEVEMYLAQFASADARIAQINAEMDVEITKIREGRSVDLLFLEAQKSSAMGVIQYWAESNKEAMFGKKRSLDMTHGTIGFRLGQWKATLAKGVKKWDEVLDACRTLAPDWIRTKEEPNKEVMINAREEDVTRLNAVGVVVVQDESFYVELKKESM